MWSKSGHREPRSVMPTFSTGHERKPYLARYAEKDLTQTSYNLCPLSYRTYFGLENTGLTRASLGISTMLLGNGGLSGKLTELLCTLHTL